MVSPPSILMLSSGLPPKSPSTSTRIISSFFASSGVIGLSSTFLEGRTTSMIHPAPSVTPPALEMISIREVSLSREYVPGDLTCPSTYTLLLLYPLMRTVTLGSMTYPLESKRTSFVSSSLTVSPAASSSPIRGKENLPFSETTTSFVKSSCPHTLMRRTSPAPTVYSAISGFWGTSLLEATRFFAVFPRI